MYVSMQLSTEQRELKDTHRHRHSLLILNRYLRDDDFKYLSRHCSFRGGKSQFYFKNFKEIRRFVSTNFRRVFVKTDSRIKIITNGSHSFAYMYKIRVPAWRTFCISNTNYYCKLARRHSKLTSEEMAWGQKVKVI